LLLGLGCESSATLHASVDSANVGGTDRQEGGEVSGSTASGGTGAPTGTGDTGATNALGGNDESGGAPTETSESARLRGGRGGRKGGNAGAVGSGGKAGKAGKAGSGGTAGTAGSGGRGGSAGAAGQGGTGGSISTAAPSTGAHVLAKQIISATTAVLTTAGVTTQSSGSALIVSAGRGSGSLLIPSTISDNKGNTPYVQQASKLNYTDYPDSSAALYAILDAKGGAGHTFSLSDVANDEGTIVAVEVKHGLVIKDVKASRMSAGNLTSPSVTTTGSATIVAFCWPGGAYGFSSVSANNSFAVLDKYGAEDAISVQAASASRDVAAAGTYNVTWTVSPAQEAILFIIALQ